MADDRRYYDDAYTTAFTGRVVEVGAYGDRPAARLDATWFYPESGGQLGDRGTLGDAPVVDVQAGEDGRVWHLLGAAAEPAGPVDCAIDWARRFDHMQQHTGQHVLSAAFERLLGAPTRSSTLGETHAVIEVGLGETDWKSVSAIERAANQVVWEDRALVLHWTDAEGVKRFALRKPPAVAGAIRIVEIPDWDLSACGGTHTRRTGEVGAIKIVRWEKVRGNLRFEFLCGARALEDHAWRTEALLEAARRRTLKDRELIAHLERAAEERDALRKRVQELTATLLGAEARERVGSPPAGVAAWTEERTREDARTLAILCLEAGAPWVVVGAGGETPVLVLGRAKALPVDLRAVLPGVIERAKGKGGGSPDLVTIAPADSAAARAAWGIACEAVAALVSAPPGGPSAAGAPAKRD